MARGSQATRPAQSRGRQAPGEGGGARGGAFAQKMRSSAPSRYLFARPTLSAGLLLALLVLLYLWPALAGGKILSPNSLLYGFAPWEGLVPADIRSYLNGLLQDVPTADYPWRFLIREMLHAGTFPSWNPYVLGGIPLWSNPQTGLFSLFSLPLWILPLNYAIGVGAALKLWAAGFGTFLLVRQLRLGFLPGLLAAVCFSFSAIFVVWLTHETLPAVAALLPWMLWLVERIYQARPRRVGSLLGLAAATAIGARRRAPGHAGARASGGRGRTRCCGRRSCRGPWRSASACGRSGSRAAGSCSGRWRWASCSCRRRSRARGRSAQRRAATGRGRCRARRCRSP